VSFAARLLGWWEQHGRHDLPWQQNRSPYRVWVSEIMLQQTQVATVIDYFNRFIARFPDLESLASAPLDDVLALWSGLGYYARARNLHKTAQICAERHGGELPETAEALHELPGIGLSTANAIVAQALDQRAPILDGNVKRVLARHAGIDGWPGQSAVAQKLWDVADARTPPDRACDYTQAIMDLGATLCTPKRPSCLICPVQSNCMARQQDRVADLPTPKPKRERPERQSLFLIKRDEEGHVLLQRRPPSGIWGGLWCLPELADSDPVQVSEPALPPLKHQFTHFSLTMHFVASEISEDPNVGDTETQWFTLDRALEAGIPKPIRQVMEQLAGTISASPKRSKKP
jgi:A/G-specific adenine glycosylase